MLRSLLRWWTSSPNEATVTVASIASTQPPPLKRRRTESADVTFHWSAADVQHVKTLRPDQEFWQHDGDVIIATILRDDEGIMVKCHRWLLVKNSPIFMDLFALPQPTAIECFEGVPLVRLPDRHAEFCVLLRMIYDAKYRPCHKHSDDLARIISGPLRLTDKYQMETLRARLIGILEEDWPTTLEGWDKREDEMQRRRPELWSVYSLREVVKLVPSPIAVMRLADEAHITSILPAVLYEMNRMYLKSICNAEVDRDRYVRGRGFNFPVTYGHDELALHHPIPQEMQLSAAELQRLLVGREFIRSRIVWFISVDLPTAFKWNIHFKARSCEPGMTRWWMETLAEEMARQEIFTDPLKLLGEMEEEIMLGNRGSICQQCRNSVALVFKDCRRAIWNDLPQYFNITRD